MNKFLKAGIAAFAVCLFGIIAYLLVMPKSPTVPSVKAEIPANYNWHEEITFKYKLEDMNTQGYDFPVFKKSGTKTIAVKCKKYCLGEFGDKPYISISLAKKLMPIHIYESKGIIYASFRYLKFAMKKNSKNVLFFTPFGKYTKQMERCILSVQNEYYIPTELVDLFDYYLEVENSDHNSSEIDCTMHSADVIVDKTPYSVDYYPVKKLNGFMGKLINVSEDGAGVYRESKTGDIYVDYNSVLYRYTDSTGRCGNTCIYHSFGETVC